MGGGGRGGAPLKDLALALERGWFGVDLRFWVGLGF